MDYRNNIYDMLGVEPYEEFLVKFPNSPDKHRCKLSNKMIVQTSKWSNYWANDYTLLPALLTGYAIIVKE